MAREQRRLAAIVSADVAGYSRLMEADETGTLAAFKRHREELFDPKIKQYGGRVVGTAGDSLLIEFGSVVDAVQCAVEVQHAMDERNAGTPSERLMELRIGVNLGDVIVDGEDIHGDGVNVAARLEKLAEPGEVCISGTVREHITGKLSYSFDDAGEQAIKNIARPIRVFRLRRERSVPYETTVPRGAASDPPQTSKPSVAVLPFTNMSGDPEQAYFSDGISEDVITELSRFRALFVIARNSSFQYRDKAFDVKRVGRELGVHYIVEGGIRRVGSRVRITAQLVDAATGNHLWAERYDRDMEDIFAIQDDVVAQIVTRVAGQVQAAETAKARRRRTDSQEAYDCWLRGLEHSHHGGPEDIEPARRLYEKAIAADPNFAQAHAALAHTFISEYWANAYKAKASDLDLAFVAATRAVALDGDDSYCLRALAAVLIHRRSFELARYHLDKAMALNPNDSKLFATRSLFEIYAGRPNAALALIDQAERLNPHPPSWFWDARGYALYGLRRYADALAAFERMPSPPAWVDRFCAACLAQLGRFDEARATAAKALAREPAFTLHRYAEVECFESAADLDHLIEGMRKAGLPD